MLSLTQKFFFSFVVSKNYKIVQNTTGSITDQYGFLIKPEFKHHNYVQMEKVLNNLNKNYRTITRLYSIGKSVQGRELYVMEVTENPGVHIPGLSRRELWLLNSFIMLQFFFRKTRI